MKLSTLLLIAGLCYVVWKLWGNYQTLKKEVRALREACPAAKVDQSPAPFAGLSNDMISGLSKVLELSSKATM